MNKSQNDKAALFRAMHRGPEILVLPNAWDAASARLYEEAGFAAVGTTSAGIANSLGYSDGQFAPREEVLFVVRRIAATVSVPVTADIEAGYGDGSLDEVLTTVRGVLEAGAVGINLEDSAGRRDSLADPELQAAKIRAIRSLGEEMGVPLVINARTDPFVLPGLTSEAKLELAAERGTRYLDAGADCIFVPFVNDAAIIAALAKAIDGPLNVLATSGVPTVPELAQLGVRRVSVGSGPHRATMTLVKEIARELRGAGTYRAFMEKTIPPAEMNALFRKP